MEVPVEKAGTPGQCEKCFEYLIVPKHPYSPNVVVGDYVLHDEIGAGGCGTVYLAYQLSLDRYCAIKILHDSFFKHEEQLQELLHEGRIAGRLHHPKIVQCYSVGEADGVYYYSMEYVEGRSLKQVIEENWKLSVSRSLDIVCQVIEGLSHAWSKQRLVHRDVKPDNIMVTAEGEVKLADMGLAASASNTVDEDDDVIKGSPHYISPEQINNTPQDFRSDIYSLGCVLYQCLTGHMVFRAENPQDYCLKHLSEVPQSPMYHSAELSENICKIVLKMLEKKPEDRYQDYSHLMNDLQQAKQNDLSGTIELAKLEEKAVGQKGLKLAKLIYPLVVAAAVLIFLTIQSFQSPKESLRSELANSSEKGLAAKLSLSAVMADPAGFDGGHEWVELRNDGLSEVSLEGWSLQDADQNVYQLSASIPANKSMKINIPLSDFTINNKGDSIYLLQDGEECDHWELRAEDIVKDQVLKR